MLNRVVLMGRLVADPELKTTNTGISVTSFRIAVDRSYVKAGEQRQADFFDIVAWRSSAEFVCRNFSKGSLIAIDGQLQSRQYQTKDGQNRTAIEVVADNVSFTGERRDTAGTYGGGYNQAPRANTYGGSQAAPEAPAQQPAAYSAGTPDDFQAMPLDDDLPF
ncbi:single-stranded DNA-binding protein [Ruminococcus sp.]|uniref:single-stranded DNA-binding protein n=1 Tax=Ruminococcus sp. TaxID=41978 RepID=UPI003864CEE2